MSNLGWTSFLFFSFFSFIFGLYACSPAGARVVNVCSRMGVIKNLGPKLQPKISDPDLTLEELDSLVAKYLDDVSVKSSSFRYAPAMM